MTIDELNALIAASNQLSDLKDAFWEKIKKLLNLSKDHDCESIDISSKGTMTLYYYYLWPDMEKESYAIYDIPFGLLIASDDEIKAWADAYNAEEARRKAEEKAKKDEEERQRKIAQLNRLKEELGE